MKDGVNVTGNPIVTPELEEYREALMTPF